MLSYKIDLILFDWIKRIKSKNKIMKKYRYDFSKDFLVYLDRFSELHINESRSIFNSAWLEWKEMNMGLVNMEVEYLVSMGYEGDVIAKMYHHVRYSLRKKLVKIEKEKEKGKEKKEKQGKKEKEDKKVGKEKKEKEGKKETMKKIVCHIEYFIKNGFICDHSPGEAFDDFYNDYLFENDDVIGAAAAAATLAYLKKSYKNKYYVIVRSFIGRS